MDLLSSLKAAHTAAKSPDRLALLDHLLDAWRASRAPALADLVDVLGANLDRSLAPVAESGPRGERARPIASPLARHQRFMDLCNLRRAADITRLAAALPEGNGTQGREKVERLRKLPHDPRFASALVRALGTGWTNVPKTFHQLHGYLCEAQDVRGLPGLQAELQRNGPSRVQAKVHLVRTVERLSEPPPELTAEARALVESLALLVRDLAALPPLTEAEVLADRASPTPAGANEAELLARVYADLGNDEARQVYGDCLLERGDPRGEFLALQFKRRSSRLSAKEDKRERDLLKEHVRTWLGPLEPVVDLGKRPGQVGSVVFERGFLAACRTAFKSPTQRKELVDDRRWATCTRLLTDEPALIAHAQMKALRSVGELPLGTLSELLEEGAKGVEELETVICRAKKGQAERLLSTKAREAFPSLKRLALDLRPLWSAPDWAEAWNLESLVRSPLLHGLETIEVEVGARLTSPDYWLPLLEAASPRRVVLSERQTWHVWRLQATRAERGWDCVYSGRTGKWGESVLFTDPLHRLDPARLRSLVLEIAEDAKEDAHLEKCLARLRQFSPTEQRVAGSPDVL